MNMVVHFNAAWKTALLFLIITTYNYVEAQRKFLYPPPVITAEDITKVGDLEYKNLPNLPLTNEKMPLDCAEIKDVNRDAPTGVYTISPLLCPGQYFHVLCDMDQDGGGWIVISERENGTIDFYRGWYFYEAGFGNLNGEFYLGNEKISCITRQKAYELKIDLDDVGGESSVAGYAHFFLYNKTNFYALHVDSYYGDAGDYLTKSNGSPFSTYDRDNDGTARNCPEYYHSAWWYSTYGNDCPHSSNLFGYYFLGRKELPHFAGPGLSWKPVPGPGGPAIKRYRMKIRPMGYLGGGYMTQGSAMNQKNMFDPNLANQP